MDQTLPCSHNQIICGDCLETMHGLPDAIARLVIADPPYYNVLLEQEWDRQWQTEADYLAWTGTWLNEAMRLLVPGGLLYCFGQVGKREHVMLHLMAQATQLWTFHDLIIWDRVVGYNERRDSFTPAHEMILVLRKAGAEPLFNKDAVREPYDKATIARYARDNRYKDRALRMTHLHKGKYATNIWQVPSLKGSSKEKVGHPSQKPAEIIRRIILSSTMPDDLVFDPFMGSGTTAVVAKIHNRRWLGVERNPDYIAMAQQRLEACISNEKK